MDAAWLPVMGQDWSDSEDMLRIVVGGARRWSFGDVCINTEVVDY